MQIRESWMPTGAHFGSRANRERRRPSREKEMVQSPQPSSLPRRSFLVLMGLVLATGFSGDKQYVYRSVSTSPEVSALPVDMQYAVRHAIAPQIHGVIGEKGEGMTIIHLDALSEHSNLVRSILLDPDYGIVPKAKVVSRELSPAKLKLTDMQKVAKEKNLEGLAAFFIQAMYDAYSKSLQAIIAEPKNPKLRVVIIPSGATAYEMAKQIDQAVFSKILADNPKELFELARVCIDVMRHLDKYPDIEKSQKSFINALQTLRSKNVLTFISVGNEGPNFQKNNPIHYNMLATQPAICVGIATPNNKGGYSPSEITPIGYGDSNPKLNPSLLVLGKPVVANPDPDLKPEKRVVWWGSSASVPLLGGLATLIAQRHPDWSADKIEDQIFKCVTPQMGITKDLQGQGILDPKILF